MIDIKSSLANTTVGSKMVNVGVVTSILSGFIELNQADIQLLGILIASIIGILGLVIRGVGVYYKLKLMKEAIEKNKFVTVAED